METITRMYNRVLPYRNDFYYFAIAFVVVSVWLVVARGMYGYKYDFPTIYGINLFTHSLWTWGLYAVYKIFSYINRHIKLQWFISRLTLFTLIFWAGLITVETVAYHVLLIRNIPTGMYPGLPICDCIHAPLWMKIVYLSLGPICYLLITLYRREEQ